MPSDTIHGPTTARARYLTFFIERELLGMPVSGVREVIQPEKMTGVPLVAQFISGIVNYRGTIVPVIDLGYRLFRKPRSFNGRQYVIVCEISHDGQRIDLGILIDDINAVMEIDEDMSSPLPETGANIRPEFVSSLVTADDRIITILDVAAVLDVGELSNLDLFTPEEKLLIEAESKNAMSRGTGMEDYAGNQGTMPGDEELSFLTFAMGDDTYGIPMSRVLEVVGLEEMLRIPHAMPYMKGIIDLRGSAVPVIDLRIRFDFEERAYTGNTAVVIVSIMEEQVGVIVDSVFDVVALPAASIKETLHYPLDCNQDFIGGIGQSEGGMIVLVDIDSILTGEEIGLLPKGGDAADTPGSVPAEGRSPI